MDYSVITDYYMDIVGERRVTHALFTTFNFEPEFFETEIIPLLLPEGVAFSSDVRVKQFQIREKLRESETGVQVFYDRWAFDADVSPQMEYIHTAVDLGNHAFHPKLVFLLLNDGNEDSLIVGAGSNNLTKAGWWDNIECLHSLDISEHTIVPDHLHAAIQGSLEYLKRLPQIQSEASPLDAINSFWASLQRAERSPDDALNNTWFYGPATAGGNFIEFLGRSMSARSDASRLEIISPFFAEAPDNNLHALVPDLGAQEIALFLPTDETGAALVNKEYFNTIGEAEQIGWAAWRGEPRRSLGLGDKHYRRLHAKVFNWVTPHERFLFVGSVNFTRKALFDNAEAGFLLRDSEPLALLDRDDTQIDHFIDPTEGEPGEDKSQKAALPGVALSYDWVDDALVGLASKPIVVTVHNNAGDAVITDWILDEEPAIYVGETSALRKLLQRASLCRISGHYVEANQPYPDHTLLLQQTGWTHKPLDLPSLTPEQILAIYAGMDSQRRELMLVNAQVRQIILSGNSGDLTQTGPDEYTKQFFSEYAQIFQAFRKLQETLESELELGNLVQLDYYLSGAGMDSLPALIDRALTSTVIDSQATDESDGADDEVRSDSNQLSAVSAYLLLLSVREVYRSPDYCTRPHVSENLRRVDDQIKQMKQGDLIKLEDNTDRTAFFDWFETEFYREYRPIETADVVNA